MGPGRPPTRAPRTLGLCDVDQAAEDLAHAWLQGEVLGASGHRDDQVGRFQVPVLGQQLIEDFGVGVAGQADVLWEEGTRQGGPVEAAKAGPHGEVEGEP